MRPSSHGAVRLSARSPRAETRKLAGSTRRRCALALALCAWFSCSLGAVTHAQIDDTREGMTSNGLCGIGLTGYPTCPKRVGLAATGSYGYTESVGPVHGAHQRLGGTLGAGYAPFSWLSVALRFDGRLDIHPKDDRGTDTTGTGDPRLFLRSGYQLNRDFSVGGEAVVWFPGNKAPSFKPRATSVDLKAMAAWTPHALPVSVLAYVGYRLDQSAESAPDLRRLRPGDRVTIGLSDSDAVLLAVGATTRAIKRAELFGELSLDYLVGSQAPKFSQSPLRAMLGARGFLNKKLQGEVSTMIGLSGRPSVATSAPLVLIEPRFLLNIGVRYGFDLSPPPAPDTRDKPGDTLASDEPRVPAVQTASISGTLVDGSDAPLPDVRVVLTPAPPAPARETVTDGDGRYAFDDVPVGPATLEAAAPGFESQQWTLDVRPQMAPEAKRPLVRKGNTGTLRLLTRTFASDPLSAAVLIRDLRGHKVVADKTNAEGLFEFDLPPGQYVVMISAPGYRPHRREVQIERYGVAILNVDMREEK
ncbi:MAG: hypothetical protein JWN04_342 [Myxococcaceae bacterium]|nr:hypothetical protein [Myxococcaceae bacterium]